jgi:hypothetical protein
VADIVDPKWLEAESEQMSKALAQLQPFLANSYANLHPPAVVCDVPIELVASRGFKSTPSGNEN